MIEQSKWIATPPEVASPLITRSFCLHGPVSGSIEVTGLGYFVLFCNGVRVGDAVHTPAQTDYFERGRTGWNYALHDDSVAYRVLYLTYDLTPYLHEGENRLTIWLGDGWLRQHERICEGQMTYSERLLACYAARLTDADGEKIIFSDGSEEYAPSCVTYTNLYIGEHIDARLADAPAAGRVTVVPTPETSLEPQTCSPDRVIRTIEPRFLHTFGGRKIYDCGENITGRVAVTAGGKTGEEIVLRYAEELEVGALSFETTGGRNKCENGCPQIQRDVYICNTEKTTFRVEFTWHGFRYFEITGDFDSLLVEVIHTDVPVISEFSCSDPTLNWMYEAYLRTQTGNLHSCIPSDCPHRERLGYTGDGQVASRTAMMLLDTREVYRKWIRDILDSQDRETGHVPHTTPPMGGGGGPGVWGAAVVVVPHEYYLHYGDRSLLEHCYPAMKHWLTYLEDHCDRDLLTREGNTNRSPLGEWATLVHPPKIPPAFVNSCAYVDTLRRVAACARVLGHEEDARACEARCAQVRAAVLRDYYDPATGSFCEGIQAADVFAIWAEIEPDGRVYENLLTKYRELSCFDSGFVGTELLVSLFFARGDADLALTMMTSGKVGSYEQLRQLGATTLWEYFDGFHSHNHPMFGAPVRHFFDGLLGIGQEPGSAGYRSLRIEPKIPARLSSAEGALALPCGQVSVGWERREREILLRVDVPDGVPARLIFAGQETVLATGKNELCFAE